MNIAKNKRTTRKRIAISTALCAGAALAGAISSAQAEVVVRGSSESLPYQEARPAPEFLANDMKIVVGQPSPSEVNPAFLGPVLLMKAGQVNLKTGTVRLPLVEGQLKNGEKVWSVLTDVSDENLAKLHGINFSAKMAYGVAGKSAREATVNADGTWTFKSGKVDFSPQWSVTAGEAPNPFPPKHANPGAIGDKNYSPLVVLKGVGSASVYNAPMLAFNISADDLNKFCDGNVDHSKVHDKVVKICPRDGTVEIALTNGWTFGKPILYLSTDASDPVIATLEKAIYAPALKDLSFANEDAQPGEAAERIYAFANGPDGKANPFRQGVNSALKGEGSPMNVLGGIPTINLDYSPMWRLFPAKWTDKAIKNGYRTRMTDAIHIENIAAQGYITSVDGGELRALGPIINCPVVYRVN